MNRITIPIRRVHLETIFETSHRADYALLEPHGGVSPLRMRFRDLRSKLLEHFHPELPATTVVQRINDSDERELWLLIEVAADGVTHWSLRFRMHYPFENGGGAPADLSELRSSPRHRPREKADVRIELGQRSIEGTIYNVSEHGLGMALLTSQVQQAQGVALDEAVQLVGEARIAGRIRSQYPADGGCVLGIELEEKLDYESFLKVEA